MNRTDHISSLCKSLGKEQIGWRQHLHRYPELSFEEHKTTQFLKKAAKRIGLKIIPIRMKTGLLAELTGKKGGPTVAIRTDIDALPIKEMTSLPFRSKNNGCMHACGHDMHMAMVLGAAKLLCQMRDELHGNVRFIFQPAEEKPPGGARPMIENGALKNVSAIFGLHVDPTLPTGKISLRDGAVMASVYDFDITILGRGGHAARPNLAVDAIVTAAEVIGSLQKITSREIDPITPAVISIGRIEGGSARNVVADRVKFFGTARVMSQQAYRKIPTLIKRTVAGICRARGAEYEFTPVAGYPVLKNHPTINRLFEKNYIALFGRGKIARTDLALGGEDFACYLQKVPGAMFRLGSRNKKIKADKPWHSPEFIADERALEYGTSLLVACTLDFLENASK